MLTLELVRKGAWSALTHPSCWDSFINKKCKIMMTNVQTCKFQTEIYQNLENVELYFPRDLGTNYTCIILVAIGTNYTCIILVAIGTNYTCIILVAIGTNYTCIILE